MSSHVHPISRKRKEREPAKSELTAAAPSLAGKRLLAGYLAHEFLTEGTLFGKQWPPERAEPESGIDSSSQSGPFKDGLARSMQTAKAYEEVAYLLKSDGVHIPGVVNPTDLARWLRM